MIKRTSRMGWVLASLLPIGACAPADHERPESTASFQADALAQLRAEAGAEVTARRGENGALRVLALSPRFPLPAHESDPGAAALRFLTEHHDVFQLGEGEAASFTVARLDRDPKSDARHATLQRLVDGDPVYQGAITVHMTTRNEVFGAVADDFYRSTPPTNRKLSTPAEAVRAAARALGLGEVSLSLVSSDRERTVFSVPGLIDAVHVTPKVFQVSRDDSRFVHQVTLGWNDTGKRLQYWLALVDAETGELLHSHSLVDSFSGRVFTASPGATPATDGRVLVSFDGNPAASPQGWVGATRKTIGNNAVAATDLNADNRVSTNEVQPTADASDAFDFPFSPTEDGATFKEAAIANAFYLANDWHDRTYLLGFTESAGNFQTSNFGKGGAQNDEVQIDGQDGAGTDNASFATPPDGQRPRLQAFLFDLAAGTNLRRDGDFDPSVLYHEMTHGLSNRLVGGGSTGCLLHLQSGGMGEGWSDFLAASFLGEPVIGAYVTGNATVGIRRASMASSPFTYADIQNRSLSEIHDAGELWAATLWDIRTALGQMVTEPLVVAAMKLTPCNPSMLDARDAILQADTNLAGGANRCSLWTAFAARGMGDGAFSPNDTSTTSIVPSTALPSDCPPPSTTRTFSATDLPLAIPDNDATGVRSSVLVDTTGLDIEKAVLDIHITHPYRGDLGIQLSGPRGKTLTLSHQQGGSADDFVVTGLDITRAFVSGGAGSGTWQLSVRDTGLHDVGTIDAFSLTITSTK